MSTTEEQITTLALTGISTVEVVAALFDTVSGLAQILAETIAVAELPPAFTRDKVFQIDRLMTEADRSFEAAAMVLPG